MTDTSANAPSRSNRTILREQFEDTGQQHEADIMGLYIFLATEIMLFGGLFATILVVRFLHPDEVVEAARKLHIWIGAANTVLLLTSSFLVTLAVQGARAGRQRATALFLAISCALGIGFLALKAWEYSMEIEEGLLPLLSDPTRFSGPVEKLYMNLYLVSTSLHAVHLTIGIVMMGALAAWLWRRPDRLPRRAITIESAGLYWHLVDVVWMFLYPILYLAR